MRQSLFYALFFSLFIFANTLRAGSDSTTILTENIKIRHEQLHLEGKLNRYAEQPDIIERFLYGKAGNHEDAQVRKLPAVLITIFLGPFGGHRIYLGTDVKVPIIYTLTLGGGLGILPLCDIVAILVNKNLNDYAESSQIIMWISGASK